jgi:hypothetical protein
VQSVFLGAWIGLNVVAGPSAGTLSFILLNLVLNVIGTYTAPLILMAQNRDAERDRLMMHEDFETNEPPGRRRSRQDSPYPRGARAGPHPPAQGAGGLRVPAEAT